MCALPSSQRVSWPDDVDWLTLAAHEVATPLATVRLRLELLAASLGSPEAAAARESVTACLGVVDHTMRLLTELLEAGRVRGGRLRLSRRRADLRRVVGATVERMRAAAERAGCPLTFAAPAAVRGSFDAARVDQVVTALLSNAFKYARGAPVAVGVRRCGATAAITVRDRGAGIDARDLPHLFAPFHRGHHRAAADGAGLGLFVAQAIARLHGGNLGVESAPGQGSCFTLRLPLSARRPARRRR